MRKLAWLLAVSGCALEDRFLLQVPIIAGAAGEVPAEVTLTQATVVFADLRMEEPPRDPLASVLSQAVGGSVAYAHPGHDYAGDVAGELLGTFTVDLLAEDQELGPAPCYEGEYATARLKFLSAHLAGSHAGVPFDFELTAQQDITGIPFDEILGPTPQPLALRFDLSEALRYTDWSSPDNGDGVLTMEDEVYGHTVLFGVIATPTWSLQQEEG